MLWFDLATRVVQMLLRAPENAIGVGAIPYARTPGQ
jgi:hypothetical protein